MSPELPPWKPPCSGKNAHESISVVTVTHDRTDTLLDAVASVAAQRVNARVRHVIVGDASPTLEPYRPMLMATGADLEIVHVPRERAYPSVSARLGALRNLGVLHGPSDWIAFLDDDNVYAPEHLSTLLDTARTTGCPIVHSHRVLVEPDGTPWNTRRFPWPCPGLSDVEAIDWLEREGVLARGSSLMRDRAMLSDGKPGTVDTSEWLVRRELCIQISWPEDVTRMQEISGIGEDGAWLRRLLAAGVAIACSERPTLQFRLGGRFERHHLSPAAGSLVQ